MNNFKIFITIFFFLLILCSVHTTSYSQSKNGDEITITGEVVDANCYMQDGAEATGSGHKDCAVTCAKAGSPLAILTKDGVLYYPIAGMGKNPNDKLMDYIAQKIEVKGTYYSQGNSNIGIKIASIKKVE
jgi:type 1 fimbria pilin